MKGFTNEAATVILVFLVALFALHLIEGDAVAWVKSKFQTGENKPPPNPPLDLTGKGLLQGITSLNGPQTLNVNPQLGLNDPAAQDFINNYLLGNGPYGPVGPMGPMKPH